MKNTVGFIAVGETAGSALMESPIGGQHKRYFRVQPNIKYRKKGLTILFFPSCSIELFSLSPVYPIREYLKQTSSDLRKFLPEDSLIYICAQITDLDGMAAYELFRFLQKKNINVGFLGVMTDIEDPYASEICTYIISKLKDGKLPWTVATVDCMDGQEENFLTTAIHMIYETHAQLLGDFGWIDMRKGRA